MKGPFRPAVETAAQWSGKWAPRDNFSRVSDGLSNQFFIGEKHISTSRLGKCDGSGVLPAGARAYPDQDDCSYLIRGQWGVNATRVFVSNRIGAASGYTEHPLSGPMDYDEDRGASALYEYGFGSWHPEVCQFLYGDGSVRNVPLTTSVPNILKQLSFVDDGESVILP